MKLRRAWWLCVGLTAAACGDSAPELPEFPEPSMDGSVGGSGLTDGGTSGGDASNGATGRSARLVSTPGSYALVGEPYSYTPKTNTKARSFEVEGAPEGMTVRGSMLRWTPTDAQAGATRFKVRALGAGSVSEQQLHVSVAKSTLAAVGDVDANGGDVFVQGNAPRRSLGMGMMVPPRAVGAGTRMSVSELDVAPPAPNSAGPVRALRFGPSGQTFQTPARLMLPLPENVAHARARMGVYVYDPAGQWQRVPMLALDLANGLVTAKAQHFSVYAVIQSALDLEVTLIRTSDGVCDGSLSGRAVVTSPLSELALDSVNNLSASLAAQLQPEASVQDLLGLPSFTGSLRAVQVFSLMEGGESGEVLRDQRLMVTTLHVPGDGSATITHADALGNVQASKTYAAPAQELSDIAARLRGVATAASFAGGGGRPVGLAARLHLSYFEGDASQDAVNLADLGLATVERPASFGPLASSSSGDIDCDGLVDAFDATDDSIATAIKASPSAVASVFTGDAVTLSARLMNADMDVTGSWTLLDGEDATLAPVDGDPDARAFRATAAGRYLVSFRAVGTSTPLEHVFAVDVAERVAEVAPPACQPSRALDVGRVGEAVVVSANIAQSELSRSALTVQWGLVDGSGEAAVLTPASTLLARGDRVLFSPLEAGNFTVGCRVFDGASYGPLGQVDVSVVAATQNRAPGELVLTPRAMNIMVGEELKLHASAVDPDGDKLNFQWDVDGADLNEPSSDGDESYLTIKAAREGKVTVRVSVRDGLAPALETTATVLVGSAPVSTVDADKDGWSPGTGPLADCNDADPNVHPTAVDLCGDRVDADCDGVVELDDCDRDGYTLAQGDCDDADPNRHPRRLERCDGIDNDCNGTVDDRFTVGATCQTGAGQCTSRGVFECSADGLTQLCAAKPQMASAEICDGADNDCDGLSDEDDVCRLDAGVMDPNAPMDGGVDAGTSCSPRPEQCTDGIDNDCDGAADGNDAECQGTAVAADDCSRVRPIEADTLLSGSFDGMRADFASACASDNDVVFAFSVKEPSAVSVTGMSLSAWSIQSGLCNSSSAKLSEEYCARDLSGKSVHTLTAGSYYLVVKGGKGPFTLTLNVAAIPY